ncbi:MAG: protein kinase [Actinomycetota bacterium]|nr:protein kinase [Actinomycetota bacterium]
MSAITRNVSLPDRYRVTSHIANGGMAGVWAAEDSVLGRCVAVKLLASHYAEDSAAVERFQREARAAASLSGHPHVVTIYDVGEHGGRPYIVMEHMQGGSLADVMRSGRPDRREALAWLRDAAAALDAAHQQGIVHRDIKPGNLLLDARRRLSIGDFGIARVALEETLTATGQVLGTAAYIAPEQISGRPATPASDRYSLGVVAYQLLTGTRPFNAENFAAQARAQVEDEPEPPTRRMGDLPDKVDGVLLRALAKDPAARWPTATAFVDALERALAPAPAEATTTPTRPLAARPATSASASSIPWWRRRAAALAGLAAVGVAAILALALTAGGGSDRSAPSATKPKAPTSPAKRQATTPPSAKANDSSGSTTSAPTGADGAALNDQGHALAQAGRYADAVPILQRAVDAACPSSGTDLTCAYALFNLGHSLRLAGRPGEAVPVLQRRLQFANQRDVVQRELDLARSQAGQGGTAAAAPAPASGGERGKGKAKDKGKGGNFGESGD